MEKFSISVIIPVFNGEAYLSEAIQSVLEQSVNPFEVIVVNDGSTDNSKQIAHSFISEIKLINQTNKGCGNARNNGILASQGNYLAFLDADDLWVETKLEQQIDIIKNKNMLDMVFGGVEQFVSPELDNNGEKKLRNELKVMPGYIAGTMLIKKDTFLKVGMFNEKLEVGEYIDWFGRARDMGLNYHLSDAIVLKRRIHNNNMGVYLRNKNKDYTTVLRAALERKRKQKRKLE